jgi:acyl-coenzyme A synthetase/AMP-(fatty) acid ligase
MLLSQVLKQGRDRFPHAVALYHGDMALTYEQLFHDVESVAAHLAALGIGSDTMVATDIQSPVSHWLVLLALMRIGAVSASLTDRGVDEIATLQGVAAVISGANDPRVYPDVPRHIRIGKDWLRASPELRAALPPMAEADRTVGRIAFTSGTSGRPKAIVLEPERLRARLARTAARTCINTRTTLWCGLGPDTAYGFTATVATWEEGGAVVFSHGGRGTYPYFAERHVNLIVASPAALTALLRDAMDSPAQRLSGLVIVAGGRLSIALRDAVRRRLCPEIMIAFGASETGGVSLGTADELDRNPGHVGSVFSDVQARIVDEQGVELPIGAPGLLQVRSDSSASFYLNDAQATARHFKEGWFQSGDVAKLEASGALILLGRPADSLNVGGVKIAADQIDAAAREHPDVEDACALMIGAGAVAPKLAVIVVGVLRNPAEVAALVRARLPISQSITLIAAEFIPRGPMGKVNRQALGEKIDLAFSGTQPDDLGFTPRRIGAF